MAAETIHSGQFMVSHFEAEANDDDNDGPAPAPDDEEEPQQPPRVAIDSSLNKLFQCMTLAYRQKLTSPKWNRFKGVKLRWKEKIRLNNVIWRCWHMQFIMKQNTLVCQFASPLDVDTHIKPETTILEGKYWKRRAAAVKAEYKKWRMYYRNKAFGCSFQDVSDVLSDMDVLDWQSQGDNTHMLVDEDYLSLMSDTLFSTITNNQPFAFPDTREIARGAVIADFIQPSLGPLQPNLDDFMDTLEPLQELINSAKLPPVPEESVTTDDSVYQNSFPQQLMESNFQQPLQQTSQFSMSQMSTQHMPHLSQTHHPTSSGHGDVHQSLAGGLQAAMSQSASLDGRQPSQNPPMLSRQQQHEQNQNFISSVGSQNAQIDMTSSVITQNQSQPIMLQQYGIISPNIIQHQSVARMQHQNAPSVQEPKASHQYMQSQKIYQQIPITGYPDRNYNISQGMHQIRSDSSSYNSNSSRRGNGGCIRERVSRQRPSPFIPPAPNTYNQFNSSPTAPTAPQALHHKNDKTSYGGSHCHEHNMISSINNAMPQNISLTAGIYLSNIGGQSDQNVNRFKMPSPPPQINNATMIALPQVPSNTTNNQHQMAKTENFRSNSLPIGASLGTMLGAQRTRRRPRSGSSSPAPPRRPPLHTTASEPSLNPASVLLAHLLTTKSQELYKSNNMQSLSSENVSTVAQPIQTVAILPAPAVPLIVPKMDPTSPQLSNFNSGSSTGAPSPQSPSSPLDSGSGKEQKRTGHIHAEQKRRYNIKTGFDMLQSLIPQLSQNPNAKVSKAAMLQKGAEYIKQIQTEMNQIKEETDGLKQQIDCLNNSISNCQSLLPATGAPVSRQRSGKLKEMFDEYVNQRTNENWKFWIFSLLMEPLLASFNNCVSPASPDELKRSTLLWSEQHCSLVEMRPAVLNSLRHLYTTTDILSDPSKLPDEARAAVNKKKSKEYRSANK